MFQVYYMKEHFFRDGIMGYVWLKNKGMMPNPRDLGATHVHLTSIEAEGLNEIYYKMQGEQWSPNGEARAMIEQKGLRHTSMSVGDVAVNDKGEAWIVDRFGFKYLGQVS